MAHIRQAVLLRYGLFTPGFQVRTWRDTYVNLLSDCDHARNLLCHCSRRAGVDEEPASFQAERIFHGS